MQLCGMMVYGTYKKLPDLKENSPKNLHFYSVYKKGERKASKKKFNNKIALLIYLNMLQTFYKAFM